MPTRSMCRAAVAAAFSLSAALACSAPEAAFQPAFDRFMQASSGDTAAVDGAADAFDTLLKAEPANPVLMAYAGASLAMKAGSTLLPWKKMNYAEDGLAMIDKALALLGSAHDAPMQHGVPGVLEVRFVAANTFLAVPGFMNRGPRGAKLLADLLAHPLFASAPLPFQGQVLMRAAALAAGQQRADEARRYWSRVVAIGAPQADAARAKLKAAT